VPRGLARTIVVAVTHKDRTGILESRKSGCGRYCCKKIFRVRAALPQPRDADDEQRRRDEALRRELFLYGKVTLPATKR